MIQQPIKSCLLMLFLCSITSWSIGQTQAISLDEALNIAKKNYAGLERDRLNLEQYQQLSNAGLPMQATQISVSGEEFRTNGATGIHSFNLQQNFYLPKASKAQQNYYQKGAGVAEKRLRLTEKELEWQVEEAYYQLLFAKEEQALAAENVALFNDFLSVATLQLEAGETGKIPQLAARTRLGQAQLAEEHAEEKYQIALSLFNQWLRTEGQFDAKGDLVQRTEHTTNEWSNNNPHLQIFQAQKEMAVSAVEVEKSKLLPQINTGARLQSVSGNFPFFGYQLGVNIPLFKKNYSTRIEAAKIGVLVQEAALKAEEQRLTQIISDLEFKLEHQRHILEYLTEDLRPIVEEQSEVNRQAFQEGEISYLEYLNSLEQVVLIKHQHLEALYEFNVLQVELDYWMGR
ncbi:MAG: TolC family protein [Chitinophagales bacterium]|nr:TolC family protein [Chitinophagales bacterium]